MLGLETIRSVPEAVLGKAIMSRIEFVRASKAIILSRPTHHVNKRPHKKKGELGGDVMRHLSSLFQQSLSYARVDRLPTTPFSLYVNSLSEFVRAWVHRILTARPARMTMMVREIAD